MQKGFLSFLIKAFANFENLIRFHWKAFIVYKNGEHLKFENADRNILSKTYSF